MMTNEAAEAVQQFKKTAVKDAFEDLKEMMRRELDFIEEQTEEDKEAIRAKRIMKNIYGTAIKHMKENMEYILLKLDLKNEVEE